MDGIAIAGCILERVKFFPCQKQGQRLQKAVGGEVGGQTQALLERGPAGGGIRADKTLIQQVGLGDMGRCRGFSLPLKRRAGATFEGEGEAPAPAHITKADLLDKGLIGPNSAARRAALQQRLGLPAHLTANGLLEALTLLLTREEFDAL